MADESADRFEKQEYAGPVLRYRFFAPKELEPGRKYPLVIFLHGAGERGDDNELQLIHGVKVFVSEEFQKSNPCFVIAPQCPREQSWANIRRTKEQATLADQPSEPMRLVVGLIGQLERDYPIDTLREYVTGLSMGGYGTWDLIMRFPNRFAAAVPICGGGDVSQADRIKSVPIWDFHGDSDPAVPVERSREMIAALKAAGGEPHYTEYPGVGHDSWTQTYADPEVLKWMFEQHLSEPTAK